MSLGPFANLPGISLLSEAAALPSPFGAPSTPIVGESSDNAHPSVWDYAKTGIAAASAATGSPSMFGKMFGLKFDTPTIVTGILGLMLIAAGLFALKPVHDTVVEVTKTAGKAAAVAA